MFFEPEHLTALPSTALRAYVFLILLPLPKESFQAGQKMLLALLLGILATPFVPESLPLSLFSFVNEIFVGILLGLPLALVINLVGVWAELFDSQRGQTFGAFFDPSTGAPSSQSGTLFRSYILATICILGGGEVLLAEYLESFQTFPIGGTFLDHMQEYDQALLLFVHRQLELLLTLYLPFSVFFLIVDLCFAFASKALPKVPVYHESFIVKTFVGFFLVILFAQSSFFSELLLDLSMPIYKVGG